jgi:hypothetical protein
VGEKIKKMIARTDTILKCLQCEKERGEETTRERERERDGDKEKNTQREREEQPEIRRSIA